ncbi:MAG: hypothetical protein KKF44_01615 [Nanoarchaeota archaeon]|nr:hypothetical protein [Nanoarchaeota archaeon]
MSGGGGGEGGGQGGGGHESGFFHAPFGEMLKNAGHKEYHMPKYYLRSLDEIESKLKTGQLSKKELKDYFTFLDTLSHEIEIILGNEKAVHISNIELEKHFRRITQLLNQVAGIA